MKHLRKGNVAFWKYDLPGKRLLSGEIEKVSAKSPYPGPGHVVVKGMEGYWIRVLFCLPPLQAKQLKNILEDAFKRHQIVTNEANAEYIKTIKEALPLGVDL